MPTELSKAELESLDNTMLCAKWIISQFQAIHCDSIARIFQKALDDAYSWIQTMAANDDLPHKCADPIHLNEAQIIHNILVRYASINNPEVRKTILSKMMSFTAGQIQ